MNTQGSQVVKEPKPSGQVSNEIDILYNRIEELHSAIDSLEERVTSVINERDTESEGSSEERQRQVPLAMTLSDHNSKLANATNRIISIMHRIEL